MKKRIKRIKVFTLFIIVCMISVTMFVACTRTKIAEVNSVNINSNTSMFVKIETTDHWVIVYHKETRVMYAVSDGGRNQGTFTLLVNADGSPMIYTNNYEEGK